MGHGRDSRSSSATPAGGTLSPAGSVRLEMACGDFHAQVEAAMRSFQRSTALLSASESTATSHEQVMSLLEGVKSTQLEAAGAGTGIVRPSAGDEWPQQENLPAGLASLRRLVEQHQAQQCDLMSQLILHWEQRFATLEQATRGCFESATVATTQMNERLAKFMGFAGKLEGAVEFTLASSASMASLSKRMERIEEDMAALAQGFAKEHSEREGDRRETHAAASRGDVQASAPAGGSLESKDASGGRLEGPRITPQRPSGHPSGASAAAGAVMHAGVWMQGPPPAAGGKQMITIVVPQPVDSSELGFTFAEAGTMLTSLTGLKAIHHGFRIGDEIAQVSVTPVSSQEDFTRALEANKASAGLLTFGVLRVGPPGPGSAV